MIDARDFHFPGIEKALMTDRAGFEGVLSHFVLAGNSGGDDGELDATNSLFEKTRLSLLIGVNDGSA